MNMDEIKLREILQLESQLNEINDLDILLERILSEARKVVNADAGSIYIRNGDELIFSHSQNDTLQKKLPPGKKLIYSTFVAKINTKSIAGYVASSGAILNIPDVYELPSTLPYTFDRSYDHISNYTTRSMLTVPLKTSVNDIVGVLQIINAKDSDGNIQPFSAEDEPFVQHFAGITSMIIQRARLTRTILLRMISMAELRDPGETGAHVNRVASYAVEIYERWAKLRNTPPQLIDKNRDTLRMAAMLHDVGKIAISDLILKKPAGFTKEEYETMKSHTFLGARLFRDRQSDLDDIAAIVALTHHENWDGTGYPGHVNAETGAVIKKDACGKALGLKGEEIPIYGRIVAIADVYDALTSNRIYKKAWNEDAVIAEMKKLSGTKFDPELVDVFLENIDFLRSIRQHYPDSE